VLDERSALGKFASESPAPRSEAAAFSTPESTPLVSFCRMAGNPDIWRRVPPGLAALFLDHLGLVA